MKKDKNQIQCYQIKFYWNREIYLFIVCGNFECLYRIAVVEVTTDIYTLVFERKNVLTVLDDLSEIY